MTHWRGPLPWPRSCCWEQRQLSRHRGAWPAHPREDQHHGGRGTPPDLGYLNEQQAFLWAEEGVILDLTPHFRADPEASNRLAASYYNYADGARTIGTNTAAETMILYYNKSLFEAAGVDYPPSQAG